MAMVNILPQEGFPFGNNIHFAYCINSGKFLFIHPSIEWAASGDTGNHPAQILSKIEAEDLIYLKEIFSNLLAGRLTGRISLKLQDVGAFRWLQVTPFLAEKENVPLILGSVEDVSDEVTNLQTVTKFANKKNSILHMLGHDLRGPLNIAKSLATSLGRQTTEPAVLKKTAHISSILQQCIDMIADLVNREFLETTSAELLKKRVDIVSKIREYLEECKRSESLAGISFHLLSSSDKIFIKLDDAKFMQVINNLVSNSLKFTPSGGSVTVEIKESPGNVNFKFSDTGIGIPETLLPEIFEKFSPAGRPGLQGEPSIGLGLSIVKTIVGWHDGKITCESKEGEGTTFFITLPKNIPG
jgi:two-component system sensor histidine kinase VicK